MVRATLTAAIVLIACTAPPHAGERPSTVDIPTEAEKIEALKLGYELNGNSMVRHPSLGSIDLSRPAKEVWPDPPLKKGDRKK